MSELLYEPHPYLHQECEECEPEHVEPVVAALVREINLHPDAVGLAAPQIGIMKRVFVLRFPMDRTIIPYINPVWRPSGPATWMVEGCLSIPGEQYAVIRNSGVVVKGEGYPEHRLSGLLASAVQHECDHLDGVLISDHGRLLDEDD